MKKKILISLGKENCGVHQFGLLVAEALEIDHVSVMNANDIESYLRSSTPDLVIWNWHPATLASILSPNIRFPQVKMSLCLLHEFDARTKNYPLFDGVVFPDPTSTFRHPRIFSCGRVLPSWLADPGIMPTEDEIVIGTFGFAVSMKGYQTLLRYVEESFEKAVVRIHIPPNWAVDPLGVRSKAVFEGIKNQAGPNTSVEFSSEFLSRRQLIHWLQKNSINVFPYDPSPHPGLSSSIDLALASGRPLAITRCGLFRHLTHLPITLESFSLKEIMKLGECPLGPIREQRAVLNFRKRWDWIIAYLQDAMMIGSQGKVIG